MISLTFTKLHNQPLVANSTQLANGIESDTSSQMCNCSQKFQFTQKLIEKVIFCFNWKYIEDLNNLINQIDQIDIFKAFTHIKEYLFFSK